MLFGSTEASEARNRTVLYGVAMSDRPETPFDNIEGALEYVGYLLDATKEAQKQIDAEIERSESRHLTRRKQAFQLVSYKLATLASHISTSRHLLRDLRMLRRLLLEERGDSKSSKSLTG